MYLSYDIPSIQQFIFSVPKLKCIIGASGLIVEFDDRAEGLKGNVGGVSDASCRGGNGILTCADNHAADRAQERLIDQAREFGLNIRFGRADDFFEAKRDTNQVFNYVPSSLDGFPCTVSGAWPVPGEEPTTSGEGIHPVISHRLRLTNQDVVGKQLYAKLQREVAGDVGKHQLEFFKTVSIDPEDKGEARIAEESRAGCYALGGRNRWAIVMMDGNDIGSRFRKITSEDEYKKVSRALTECTKKALVSALAKAVDRWAKELGPTGLEECRLKEIESNQLILPFRPLIIGGDDLTMLCHASYAFDFVQEMSANFSKLTQDEVFRPLWPERWQHLSISAGVLFSKVSFPLHMAIPYTEQLLDNAKERYRHDDGTPAAIDWDNITDTLVDDPTTKRNRELYFEDGDINKTIRLTLRPYLLEENDSDGPTFDSLKALSKQLVDNGLTHSVLARLLPNLRRPWSERMAFVASIAKRHEFLWDQLREVPGRTGSGWFDYDNSPSTSLLDAVTVLEEKERMLNPTVSM